MIERQPLTEVQNGSFARPKVQKTYGKKGKALAALASAKDIFVMTADIDQKLNSLTITEEKGKFKVADEEITRNPLIEKVRQPRRVRAKKRTPIKVEKESTSTTESENKLSDQDHDRNDTELHDFVKNHSDRKIISFESYGKTIDKQYCVKKIGEGTYSSVFALLRKEDGIVGKIPKRCAQTSSQRTTILKVMPILQPHQNPDTEGTTAPYHIASELSTMRTMDPIHGFIRYRGLLVVKGAWPASFLQAFRYYASMHPKKAENEDPESAFDATHQHYALIEMEDAGIEICEIERPSDFQIHDIFWMTAIHLANAETAAKFEHRDLHVSNICVKPDDLAKGDRMDIAKETVANMTEPPEQVLGMSNISVTLIDYTFSRVDLPPGTNKFKPTNFREWGTDDALDYDELFEEQQSLPKPRTTEDFEDRLQQLCYAKTAKLVKDHAAQAERNGTAHDKARNHHVAPWEHHVPRSNVCWLGYLIVCLLQRAGKMAKTKYVPGSNDVAKEMQDGIRKKLLEIKDVVCEDEVDEMPASATEVVTIGVERGLLTRAEINRFKERLERDS